jgi:hypothetical protein
MASAHHGNHEAELHASRYWCYNCGIFLIDTHTFKKCIASHVHWMTLQQNPHGNMRGVEKAAVPNEGDQAYKICRQHLLLSQSLQQHCKLIGHKTLDPLSCPVERDAGNT